MPFVDLAPLQGLFALSPGLVAGSLELPMPVVLPGVVVPGVLVPGAVPPDEMLPGDDVPGEGVPPTEPAPAAPAAPPPPAPPPPPPRAKAALHGAASAAANITGMIFMRPPLSPTRG